MTTAPERIWADANRQWSSVGWSQSNEFVGDVEYVRADIASTLTAERDEAINQLDSAIHSQIVLEKRTAAVMEDRKFILEERDRTFALMLARAEAAEAERDHAWAMVEKADTQMGQSLADHLQAKAERDRLREALERISRFTHISPWGHETQSYEANIARAALKGETA